MNPSDLPSPSVASRRIALAAVVVLHLLAIVLWSGRQQGRAVAATDASIDIVFVAPLRVKPAPTVTLARPVQKAVARAERPAAVAAPAMTLVAPAVPAAEAVAPPVEAAAPAVSAADILDRAKRDIGGIDRAVRKQSLDMAVRDFKPTETRLERAIDSAYSGGGGVRIVEVVLPDGSRISKVIMGKKSYCVTTGGNGLVGARDVFKSGVQTKVTNCPT